MRYLKMLLVVVLVCVLVACGQKSDTVFMEKEGTLYEIKDLVSFYYPKTFIVNQDNEDIIQFTNENELFSYTTRRDDFDNEVEDMPELYRGELEENGAENIKEQEVELDSAIVCHEFSGQYVATGIQFKHLVYFTRDAVFIYVYQAPQDVYEENIHVMTQYLRTLTVNKEEVS